MGHLHFRGETFVIAAEDWLAHPSSTPSRGHRQGVRCSAASTRFFPQLAKRSTASVHSDALSHTAMDCIRLASSATKHAQASGINPRPDSTPTPTPSCGRSVGTNPTTSQQQREAASHCAAAGYRAGPTLFFTHTAHTHAPHRARSTPAAAHLALGNRCSIRWDIFLDKHVGTIKLFPLNSYHQSPFSKQHSFALNRSHTPPE